MSYQTTWSEFNRIINNSIPLERSNLVLIGGVTHSYKTGLSMDLLYQICTCNDAIPDVAGKAVKAIYVATEESATSVFERIYNVSSAAVGALPLSALDLRAERAPQTLRERLGKRGWDVDLLSMNISSPTYTIGGFCDHILGLQTDDTEIHVVIIDGVGQLDRGLDKDFATSLKYLRDTLAARNILVITTHQLTYSALKQKASDVSGVELLTNCYLDSCWADGQAAVAKAVDLELLIDRVETEESPGVVFLAGSHRHSCPTPLESRTTTLPFNERLGTIPITS